MGGHDHGHPHGIDLPEDLHDLPLEGELLLLSLDVGLLVLLLELGELTSHPLGLLLAPIALEGAHLLVGLLKGMLASPLLDQPRPLQGELANTEERHVWGFFGDGEICPRTR